MTTFQDLGLPENIVFALTKAGFLTPTPIQAQAIPPAIAKCDVLGSAQTGTGKTAAFVLPMLVHLQENPDSKALILLPTRELAMQVLEMVRKLIGPKSPIKRALIIGGDSLMKQFQLLKENPRIIIGTPGRINDHLVRKSLKLDNADFIVLDETDRMLDMGFGVQLDEILKYVPKKRQTLMFSATLPKNINALSQKYLDNPTRICIGDVNTVAANVKQKVIATTNTEKYTHLKKHLADSTGTTLIFMKTKYATERLAAKLLKDEIKAAAIHGDLKQTQRQRVMRDFKKQHFTVLVATDIAARGLDISHIECVINYDLPQCPEDYIHRIGRTARAGASGMAINLLAESDYANWQAIVKLLQTSAENIDYGDMQFFANKQVKLKKGKKSSPKKPKKPKKRVENPYVKPLKKQGQKTNRKKSSPMANKPRKRKA